MDWAASHPGRELFELDLRQGYLWRDWIESAGKLGIQTVFLLSACLIFPERASRT